MSVDGSCNLIMGISTGRVDLAALHPPPGHVRQLWAVFLENVNPLVKIVHRPTTAKLIEQVCTKEAVLDKADEVLLFSIYLAAVISLTTEECRRHFGELRAVLSTRYQKACREALVRVKFLRTSNLHVLTGFVMYLVRTYNPFPPG
jgi:hypothetical protein